jgi:hypothetical protein
MGKYFGLYFYKEKDKKIVQSRQMVRRKNPENVQDSEISEKKNQTPVRGQDGKNLRHPRERFLLVSCWRPEIFPLGV